MTQQKIEVVTVPIGELRDMLSQTAAEGARIALRESRGEQKPLPTRIVTLGKAAEVLKVHPQTLKKRLKDGRVSAVSLLPIRFDLDCLIKELSGDK